MSIFSIPKLLEESIESCCRDPLSTDERLQRLISWKIFCLLDGASYFFCTLRLLYSPTIYYNKNAITAPPIPSDPKLPNLTSLPAFSVGLGAGSPLSVPVAVRVELILVTVVVDPLVGVKSLLVVIPTPLVHILFATVTVTVPVVCVVCVTVISLLVVVGLDTPVPPLI
jgi:hypothetical protein